MLIDETGVSASAARRCSTSLAEPIGDFCSLETHAAVVEVETSPQPTVAARGRAARRGAQPR